MRRIVKYGKRPPVDYDITPIVEQLQEYGDVVLFGSFSRGQRANDIDFLVVTDVEKIEIDNFGIKVDLKVCTREQLNRHLKNPDHTCSVAWTKGIHY